MAYTEFKSLHDLRERFGIEHHRKRLFDRVTPVQSVSSWLTTTLGFAEELPVRSEKAKSELIVMPILLELRNRNADYLTIYSGDNFNVDESAGLNGECDFILAKDTGTLELNTPIMQIVEAKRHDTDVGVPQCAAQMLAAKRYNAQHGKHTHQVYGCVTTGDDWLFLRLGESLEVDVKKFYLGNLAELLGVLQIIVDEFKNAE